MSENNWTRDIELLCFIYSVTYTTSFTKTSLDKWGELEWLPSTFSMNFSTLLGIKPRFVMEIQLLLHRFSVLVFCKQSKGRAMKEEDSKVILILNNIINNN